MGKQRKEPSPEDLDPLREQIRLWRTTRRRPNAMPPQIWDHAVVLAREFGVCRIARAVGIDYTVLRKKVAKAMELPGMVLPTFMELGRLVADEAPHLPRGSGWRSARRPRGADRYLHSRWHPDQNPIGGQSRHGGSGDHGRLPGGPSLIVVPGQGSPRRIHADPRTGKPG